MRMTALALVTLLVIPDQRWSVGANSLVGLVAAPGSEVPATSLHQANRAADEKQRSPRGPSPLMGPGPPPGEPFFTGESANVSRLIESLMRGYDKRLRPNYKGSPVEVGITIFVSSVGSISEVNMDFTVDFYFRQFWHDERLTFDEKEDELCISNEMLEKIWWPDTFFANAKSARFHLATTKNAFLRIKPTGRITQSLRLTVTAMCPMELHLFPMDVQVCPLEIESYAYSVRHISYKWQDGSNKSVSIAKNLQLPQFEVRGYRVVEKLEILTTGNYSRLACEFVFVRRLGYYIIQIYIPSSLIVVLSWVSFWLDRNAVPARVALGITTVLTLTTLISSTNAALPKISYLKSIDVYLVTCFFMVFAALLEYAAVSFIGNRKWKPKQKQKKQKQNARYASLPPSSSAAAGANCRAKETKRCRVGQGGGGGAGAGDGDRASLTFSSIRAAGDEFPGKSNPLLQDLEMTAAPKRMLTEGDPRLSSHFSDPACGSGHSLPSGPAAIAAAAAQGSGFTRGQGVGPAATTARGGCSSSGGGPQEEATKGPAAGKQPAAAAAPNLNVRRANKIDKYSRVIFPVVFAAFSIAYWVTYIHISHRQVKSYDFIMN